MRSKILGSYGFLLLQKPQSVFETAPLWQLMQSLSPNAHVQVHLPRGSPKPCAPTAFLTLFPHNKGLGNAPGNTASPQTILLLRQGLMDSQEWGEEGGKA